MLQFDDDENDRKLWLYDRIVSRIAPFNVHLDGFGIFPQNGTLFLKTVFDEDTRNLARQLHQETFTPHITIARGMSSSDLDYLWRNFKGFNYREYFHCDRVTVLKRIDTRWRPHTELLMNTTQPH
jgi:2'-5' RNA ligase